MNNFNSPNNLFDYESDKCRNLQSKLSKFLDIIKKKKIIHNDETTLVLLKINGVIDSLECLIDELYYSDGYIYRNKKDTLKIKNEIEDFYKEKKLMGSLFPLFMILNK